MAVQDGVLKVTGEMNKVTVPQLVRDSRSYMSQISGDIVVDLSAVERADSSGLAMLIEWMRMAKKSQRNIQYKNVPTQLMEIAGVSGLQDILPLAP